MSSQILHSSSSIVKPLPPKFGYNIIIVAANTDGLKETGFGSLKTCQSFCDQLKKSYANVSLHIVSDVSSLDIIARKKPDLVVLCCKYIIVSDTGEKVWLSDYFQSKNLIFTGSDKKTLQLASNKSKAKTVIQNYKIATARYFLTNQGQYLSEDRLPIKLPVFVKPLDSANGFGIDKNSVARDFSTFTDKLSELSTEQDGRVLVEEYLRGREFTVAVFDDETIGRRWTLPMEIILEDNCNGDRILGAHEKMNNVEQTKPVTEPLLTKLKSLASEAFTAVGARDFGRVDIKLDSDGEPNFLEINLVPGMTPNSSYFPLACSFTEHGGTVNGSYSGMSYAQVVNKIVEIGLARFRNEVLN